MKRLMIGMAIAVVAVSPAVAQQSLGDVAGSIKLNRPEGDTVVIDQNTVGKMRRSATGGRDGDFFRGAVGDCLAETRALYELIVECRDGEAFYREDWRDRVEEQGLRLDSARDDLAQVAVEGRYQQAYEYAERGSNAAGNALEILRGAIAQNRPVFSEARRLSDEAIRLFGDAERAIGAESRKTAAESTPPLINPIEADRVINSLCRGRFASGSSGYENCVAEQRTAVDKMTGRSAPGVGLDLASFNVIRNNCRFEWPDNYVSMDRCEQHRIAAKKPR